MAREFREVFGELLLTRPVSLNEWKLPSPAALKGKIILKHKKLPLDGDDLSRKRYE
jgi:hypothetical protein